ncbi:MAG: phosphoribosylglycinamide formyltransferase [Methanomicrobiales archaeon]|nr:phosphoribosylglycinamide formyltransferase [Methanomicrobiales archaeon]MDI6875294.1 phosphoribosylglycinamide formyltransferase [Methanomicrobiales archaeon]
MHRIAVLASGRGSNFQALIDAVQFGAIPDAALYLITDNPRAYAIQRAQSAGIPHSLVDFSAFATRQEFEQALLREMQRVSADLYVLAGYMRILGADTVHAFPGRIINIHPALLPAFPGLHAQQKALQYGVKVSGCTVHFVDEGMDTGPIILQRCVPVLDGDDEETLAARILKEEHVALPEAVRLYCEGRLELVGRTVRIR